MTTASLKSLMRLLYCVLHDAGTQCSTSIDRDWKTIQSRSKHEGLSFITITLPNFAKGLLRALERGKAIPSDFVGFHTRRGRCLPELFQGFTGLVFDVEGDVLNAPNTDAVDAIRQICVAFSKIRLECTRERRLAAEAAFLACEREVSRFRVKEWPLREVFRHVCGHLYSTVLSSVSSSLLNGELVPRHGPGSTEDHTIGNRKYGSLRWSSRLQRSHFEVDRYLFSSYSELADNSNLEGDDCGLGVEFVKREPPVRVVFVPKTLKTPRVIAIEPVWQQYCQQALLRCLVPLLEGETSPVRGHVNFEKQAVNGAMALENSRTREFATLDLSEASDRVNAALVAEILRPFPALRKAVFSCRSKYAKTPSGHVVPLKKFASMGSALCFPFEAMVFNAIVVSRILVHRNLRPTSRNIRTCQRDVFVYGDDILCRSTEVEAVVDGLHSAGLKVNLAKTFAKSHFRESCGTDAFNGSVTTPVYVRSLPPESARSTSELLSWVSTSNLFYKKGYWKTAQWLRDFIEAIVGVVPHTAEDSSVVGWYSFSGTRSVQRWNPTLHRFEVRSFTAKPLKYRDPLDGYRAMLKFFLSRGVEPLEKDAYSHSVRVGRLKTIYRWEAA